MLFAALLVSLIFAAPQAAKDGETQLFEYENFGNIPDSIIGGGTFENRMVDRIASLKVQKGCVFFAYEKPGLAGLKKYFMGDNGNLGTWKQKIKSFEIRCGGPYAQPPSYCAYEGGNYELNEWCSWAVSGQTTDFPVDVISSIKVKQGCRVIAHDGRTVEGWGFGNRLTFTGDVSSFEDKKFNDKTKHIAIQCGEENKPYLGCVYDGVAQTVGEYCPDKPGEYDLPETMKEKVTSYDISPACTLVGEFKGQIGGVMTYTGKGDNVGELLNDKMIKIKLSCK